MTALLERDREMDQISAAISEAAAGRGGAIAIVAGAGLGKTRLAEEAAEAAVSAGLTILKARGTELERDFPFALARQLFENELAGLQADGRDSMLEGADAARAALGLERVGEQPPDTFAVLHALYWVLAALADRSPLLLVVDDAHVADPASLDYLSFLLPRLDELPVLLIVTSRKEEANSSEGLQRLLNDPATRHLAPAPLSAEGTAALVTESLGAERGGRFAASCHEASGGNPFLLSELIGTIARDEIEPLPGRSTLPRDLVPDRVLLNVGARVARLGPDAKRVARGVAILAEGSEAALLSRLVDLPPAVVRAAADALRAEWILGRDVSLRFIHPLVRDAVYSEIPAGERTQAHRRAAELLREEGASVERIATQLLACEPEADPTTAETLLEAGEGALAAGAPRSAIAYLTRALQEPPAVAEREAALGSLITAGFRAADHSVLAAIEDPLREELDREPSLRCAWAVDLTMLLVLAGRFEEAGSLLREAIEVAIASDDVERAFQLEAQMSTVELLLPSERTVDLHPYRSRIEPDSPSGRLLAAMEARSITAATGPARDAEDAARRALAHDAIIFDEEPELLASAVAVMVLAFSDYAEEARSAAERALVIARARNATPDLARAWFLRGFIAWTAGRLVAAEADLRQAADLARLSGIAVAMLIYVPSLAEVLIERDQLDAAEAVLATVGAASGPLPASAIFIFAMRVRGHLLLARGDFEGACEDFTTLAEVGKRDGIGGGAMVITGPLAVRALVGAGRDDEAREFAEEAIGYTENWGGGPVLARGLTGLAAAPGQESVELLGRAAAILGTSPLRLQHAQVLLELGSALRRSGRRRDSRAPLREALELARRCGATRTARLAHEELEASGERVRRYTPIGVESLTPSERRVADLAASGMTNRQIAQTLFVTVKTVEAHLSAAYDKLDISSRGQLPDALADGSSGPE
jgi:DNA-binding CsgD family transcriptional regulator